MIWLYGRRVETVVDTRVINLDKSSPINSGFAPKNSILPTHTHTKETNSAQTRVCQSRCRTLALPFFLPSPNITVPLRASNSRVSCRITSHHPCARHAVRSSFTVVLARLSLILPVRLSVREDIEAPGVPVGSLAWIWAYTGSLGAQDDLGLRHSLHTFSEFQSSNARFARTVS